MESLQDQLERFRRAPEILATVLTGAAGEEVDWPPAPGKWTIRQIMAHLADSELVYAHRLRAVIAEENPPLAAFDQDLWANRLDYARRKPAQSLESLRRIRGENHELLKGMPEETFLRMGVHSERGPMSLGDLLMNMCEHVEKHARQLQTIRAEYKKMKGAGVKRLLMAALAVAFSAAAADDASRWWSHVVYLAGDNLEGRETGSAGHRKAAEYVASQFERAGLKPGAGAGYFQTVKLRSRRVDEKKSSLALVREGKREELKLGEHALLGMRVAPPKQVAAPMVFVGYGLTIPEAQYDDLAKLDLRGKVVVALSGGPASIPGPLRSHYASAAEREKLWSRHGVVGTIGLTNPKAADVPWSRTSAARLAPSMTIAATETPRLTVGFNSEYAEKLFEGSGHTFAEMLALADQGKALPVFPLVGSIEARVGVTLADVESMNVAAVWPGSDAKLKNEYVALSAHLDHLGRGAAVKGDGIYNGAMDNASGVASLLEIAAALRESGAKPRRSILFLAVTAEEKGLLGSKFFAENPTVKDGSIVADLNLDMFLPLFPMKILTAIGAEESDLGDRLRAVAGPLGVEVQNDPEPQRNLFIRSDQYNFIVHGVPALAFKVGYTKGSAQEGIAKRWLTERYHAPSDDLLQPVDKQAAADFNRLLRGLAEAVANDDARPRWKAESFFRRFARE